MTEQVVPDIVSTWNLRRGSSTCVVRFHLECNIKAAFVEPTRDEVRTALMQILDESLGPDQMVSEIAGWSEGDVLADEELTRLRRWKAETLPLLDMLEQCHVALPVRDQALIGHSKVEAVYRFIFRHTQADD